jgi:hypothetical protein
VRTRQAVVDVTQNGESGKLEMARAEPVLTDTAKLATDNIGSGEDKPSAWARISFSVSSKDESSKSESSLYEAGFRAKCGGWWASVETSSSVKSANESVKKEMATCDISGSW